MPPRAESQPWLLEAVGNAEWTGTPLPPILEEAGLRPDALELVFTGADHGIQGEVEQDYQWGFSLADIVKDDVLLAYELNGQPLPPQHGYPIRLLVPDWYGMQSVAPPDHGRRRALRRLPALRVPAPSGAGRPRRARDEEGRPSAHGAAGLQRLPARQRFVDAGKHEPIGRAWSGWGHIDRVEVSTDGGASWSDGVLGRSPHRHLRGARGPSPGTRNRACTSSSSGQRTRLATSSRWTRRGTTGAS